MAKNRDHYLENQNVSPGEAKAGMPSSAVPEAAFGCPRDFLGNRFVYVLISPRAGGLSIGINMNPDKKCNFDCVYCEVNRSEPARESHLDVPVMAGELKATLALVHQGGLRGRPAYRTLPAELLELRHVTLSGDGEPTLAPNFVEIVETAVHIRAVGGFPHFKLVLVTNATGLDQPLVQPGLRCLTRGDEIWAKLDGGTSAYLQQVNRPDVPIEKILQNILTLARQRPVVIQSLFLSLNGQEPPEDEIQQYALRLKELKTAGAQIPLVQIYSATRPKFNPICGHLPLRALSQIAQTVQKVSGLKAEVF
jgi:wyosine [tRNA(Phe)-imidazoG37] synthetase (radical SAM superfamily)